MASPGTRTRALRPVPTTFQRVVQAFLEQLVTPSRLVVAADGSFFDRMGQRVLLRSYRVLGALLARLAERRLSTPGQPVPAPELVAAGWPNERIADRAARNRLRVALATLRKVGLRDVLITKDGGYMIDPGFDVVCVSAAD